MNILKKTVACLAAATVMTSIAVTASADYSLTIGEGKFEENTNTMVVRGIPADLYGSSISELSITISFYEGADDKVLDQSIIIAKVKSSNSCKVVKNTGSGIEELETLNISRVPLVKDESGERYVDFWVEPISADDEYFKTFSGCTKAKIDIEALTTDGVDMSDESYNKTVEIEWLDLASTNEPVSEPASEPVSSEPVSEPTSSEPANEPVSSEPVSETESSEPTTSQPGNVDTGAAGIAAVIGTAVLAAGAVIVTRKKK